MDKTIYYYSPNACSLAGQVVLEWIAQPYTLVRVERPVRASETYGRINPLRKVPAMRVGERLITENPAILSHLAERKSGLLPPHGSAARDGLNTWMAYISSTLHAAFQAHFRPERFSPMQAHHRVLQSVAQQKVRTELGYVNQALRTTGFLGSRSLGPVDVYLYAIARWARPFCDMAREFSWLHQHQVWVEQDKAVQFALGLERGESVLGPSGVCTHEVLRA